MESVTVLMPAWALQTFALGWLLIRGLQLAEKWTINIKKRRGLLRLLEGK